MKKIDDGGKAQNMTLVKKPRAKKANNLPAVIPDGKITEATITQYMDAFGIASQLDAAEKKQFIEIAKAYQLNPFKREIYATPYETSIKLPDGTWGKAKKLSLVTGYEVYLKRATRLAVLDGWNVITDGNGDNMKAVCTIYRKDWKFPFIHEVALSEYRQVKADGKVTKFWSEKPKTMLKKVAVSQAFRLCFPDEMGGMPYTADELPPNMSKEYSEPIKIESNGSQNQVEYHSTGEIYPPAQQNGDPNKSEGMPDMGGCPNCGKKLFKSKFHAGTYCYIKTGGCGKQYNVDMTEYVAKKKDDKPADKEPYIHAVAGGHMSKGDFHEFFNALPVGAQTALAPLADVDRYDYCFKRNWNAAQILKDIKDLPKPEAVK